MILSTLDIKYYKKQIIGYLIVSFICFVFGQVYELFGHGVHSKYMNMAFLIPFFFGTGLTLLIYSLKIADKIPRVSMNLYNASLATITMYSIFKGILEIYGTTNKLSIIYIYISGLLLIISILIIFVKLKRKNG